MSNICRNNYSNHGSYLRSRGYDQQICSLINDLNNGLVVLGSVVPSGTDGVTLKGTVNINNATGSNGYLVVNGGDNTDRDLFSIQANNGMKLAGPIVQTASNVNYINDPSYNFGNVFRGNQHVFTNNDGSSNLLLNGHFCSCGAVPSVSLNTNNSETIDICANSTDTAGRIYLGGVGWGAGDEFTLTFSKPYTEAPVFIYSTEVGGNKSNLEKSVSTTAVVFSVVGNLDNGYINYFTIGIQE
jgi:hypothetical protein